MAAAWYHIDALKKAAEEYKAALYAEQAKQEKLWFTDTPTGLKWDSWFSFPKTRKLTRQEYWASSSLWHWGRFRLLHPRTIKRELEDMEVFIGLARRSNKNLVYLEKREVDDFGGFLTYDEATQEISF